MAEFIERAINTATNLSQLRITFEKKLDSLNEESGQGYEILSFIFLGDVHDRMLKAISGPDICAAQKWLLAIPFIIKVEQLRQRDGGSVPDNASHFFEGVTSTMLETLESSSPIVVGDIWRVFKELFAFILSPSVATVVKCHKRLANRMFTYITQLASTEDVEDLLIIILAWMCSNRTLNPDKEEDRLCTYQLQLLQYSTKDIISKEATSLLINNLEKLCRKDPRAILEFTNSYLNQVTKELELGGTLKISRMLELINVIFERSDKGNIGPIMVLSTVLKIFPSLFEMMDKCDKKTIDSTFSILVTFCKFLGSDLVLINIQAIAKAFDAIFKHDVDTIVNHTGGIEDTLKKMNDLCYDFYQVTAKHLQNLVYAASNHINRGKYKEASCLIRIMTQMCGCTVGASIEAFVLDVISNDRLSWNDAAFSNAVVMLIHMHIRKGFSNHPKALNMLLSFLRRVGMLRGHDSLIDETISELRSLICYGQPYEQRGDFIMYVEELQKLNDKAGKEEEKDTETHIFEPKVELVKAPVKTRQEDVVDAIRKKLKAMKKG